MQKPIKILLVDDDRIIQTIHMAMLTRLNPSFDIQLFFDGTEVVAFFENAQDSDYYYLLFLDINMPIMDGWSLLSYLEVHMPSLDYNVVIVTSSVDHQDRTKAAFFKKVIHFFVKPITTQFFEQSINTCHG